MKKWKVEGVAVGMVIVWIAQEEDSSGQVGFFGIGVYDRPYIYVMSETKSGAIAAAQAAWRNQTSYAGTSY